MSRPSRVFGSPSSTSRFATSPLKSSPLASPPVTSSNIKQSDFSKRIDSPPSSSELSLNESISSSNTSDETTILGVLSPVIDKGVASEFETELESNELRENELDELPDNSQSDSAANSSTTPLSCPICSETMVSLLQLNRHLDDIHSESVNQSDNEQLKGWFSKKIDQAKQIQKLQTVTSVFSQSLNIFDDSGSEKSVQVATGSGTAGAAGVAGSSNSTGSTKLPSDAIVRTHWKNHGTGPNGKDKCSYPTCDKFLNSRNGAIHCRKCGQLYCREHTLYQMKLALTAKHDPVNGIWSRVCEHCYKSRTDYNSHKGVVRDLSSQFVRLRQKHVDVNELEVNKLEKRLIRLIRALADLDEGLFTYTTSIRRKSIEHQVAVWQHDKDVTNCPICSQKFGYSLRKHHCRVCGKIICADLGTDCSRDVPLSILSNKLDGGSNELPRRDDIGIRICKDCKRTIFAKKVFDIEGNNEIKPEILKIYDSMIRIKHSIDITLPKFQEMLMALNDADNPPSHEVLHEASIIRRKLLTSFSQYDSMARRVLVCDVTKETDKRLQKQIYQVAAQYLQENMLPLKALPKVLKHNKVDLNEEIQPQASSSSSSPPPPPLPPTPSLSDEEIQSYREQLIVMEEQKFMVENMINTSKASRKLDQVIPLEQNLNDLKGEIDKIKGVLGSYSIT